MITAQSLGEVLRKRKDLLRTGIRFIKSSLEEEFVSYGEVYDSALKLLSELQKKGLKPKDELVFQIEDNKTFILYFWACILGGIVPVPVTVGRNDEHRRKLFLIWDLLNNPHLTSSREQLESLEKFSQNQGIKEVFDVLKSKNIGRLSFAENGSHGKIHQADKNDIAFIQFSSGSTGKPKGIILTHENLIANLMAIGKAARYTKKDSLLSWMPLTHDMGMIGFHLNPLFSGLNHHIIPSHLFIRNPELWLNKVTEHKATVIASPNFGYNYILKHCFHKAQNWNLSSVRILYNGAEPISADLCDKFIEKASAYGLNKNAICPVYGLAEASVAVSMSNPEDPVIAHRFKRNRLNIGDKVIISTKKEGSISFVNVGKSIDYCQIRILDELYKEVEESTIGHVVIRGKNVTQGYYNDTKASKEVFAQDSWLRTGDLGFIKEKSLYIIGRSKDIIFVNGQNYYPHDIERVAQKIPEIELNKIAVASYYNHELQEEKIIAFVLHRGKLENFLPLAEQLKAMVGKEMGVDFEKVLPVLKIPRTTSGKLQRFKLLQNYLDGNYNETAQKLKMLAISTSTEGNETTDQLDEVQRRVSNIWEQVLQNKKIGLHKKFFEVGGNSLKLAEISMRIHREFNIELPYELLYSEQTISEVSKQITQLNEKQFSSIPRTTTGETYPLSDSQKGLYYNWKLDKASVAYNIPIAFEIQKPFDFQKIELALKKLIDKFSLLRAFFIENQAPAFKIREKSSFRLGQIDCDIKNVHKTLRSLIRPFDLSSGNLFRVAVVNAANQKHFLFIDLHHIIADGLSLLQLLKELMALYNNQPLAAASLEYKDYVLWQDQKLSNGSYNSQEEYWSNIFKEEIPSLDLPTDHPRPKILETKGKRIQFFLGKEKSRKLRVLAKQEQTTLHTLLFSIYKWFLSKLSYQYKYVIGIPTSGRTHIDLQNAFGMFVNNLGIKVRTVKNESFKNSLKRDNLVLNKALANQEFPYNKLLENLDLQRDISRNPLFDTMFLFTPNKIVSHDGDLQLKRHFFDPGYSKFDLSFEIIDEPNIAYIIEYSTRLFEEKTIRRFSTYFENLVQQLIQKPEIVFSESTMLSEEEFTEHIYGFNSNETFYAETANETLVSLFESQVRYRPLGNALVLDGTNMNYRELNSMSERFKDKIGTKGVAKGDTVGVCLARSCELIAVLLGILKLGAVYIPIAPNTPAERINFILKDSKSKMLISSSKNHKTENIELTRINMEKDFSEHLVSDQEIKGVEPNDLAYIIYTSGTTGNPKGVKVSHASLLNYINWGCEEYLGKQPASFAFFTSIDFDLTLTSIFLPLVSGNEVIIYEEADGRELTNVLTENRATHIKLTPSHLKLIVNNGLTIPDKITTLIVGGEKLFTDTVRSVLNLSERNIVIYNEYGPTEATIGCMIYSFDPSNTNVSVPIGRPISNVKIYVLDEFLKPVPTAITGELYISGECLAKGYLGSDSLTQEKFLTNPFTKEELMYKSGDMAKKLPTGLIEYVGRTDDQIKISGRRIEKEEVRLALRSYTGVEDVVLITNENGQNGEPELLCFYISKASKTHKIDLIAIKSFLSEKLPHHMIPSKFIKIEKIPLNKNGKVDKRRLLDLDQGKELAAVEEKSDLKKLVRTAYQSVLGLTEKDNSTNFYELGGDSIKATQIASKLYQNKIKVEAKEVLIYNTIEQLSYFIAKKKDRFLQIDNYFQGALSGDKDLSPIESWFVKKDFENPAFYNQSILLDLKAPVRKDTLEKAFNHLIAHHDGLRLNFDFNSQKLFFNKNHLDQSFAIPSFSVGSNAELKQLLIRLKSSFHIEKSLLIKAAFIRDKSRQQKMLFITAHHLIMDGISWRILMEDLFALYRAIEEKSTFNLPKKTASLLEFQKAFSEFIKAEKIDEQYSYWKSIEAVEFKIPLDFKTDEWLVKNLAKEEGQLDQANTSWLLKESQVHKVDILTLLYTALVKSLQLWSGSNMVKIIAENHGRHLDHLDTSRTIGWFTILHPIIFRRKDNIKDDIRAIKEKIKNIPYHGIGYLAQQASETIVARPKEVSEVTFNYLGQFGEELNNDLFAISSSSSGRESDPKNVISTKLEINAMIISGKLQLEFLYNSRAHMAKTIENFKHSFLIHLSGLIEFLQKEDEYLLTPSDFDTVNITQEELDYLFD